MAQKPFEFAASLKGLIPDDLLSKWPAPSTAQCTINGTQYDVWKTTITRPSTTSVYYYKFKINRDQTNGFYSDDYNDVNDNVHKDGTGAASDA